MMFRRIRYLSSTSLSAQAEKTAALTHMLGRRADWVALVEDGPPKTAVLEQIAQIGTELSQVAEQPRGLAKDLLGEWLQTGRQRLDNAYGERVLTGVSYREIAQVDAMLRAFDTDLPVSDLLPREQDPMRLNVLPQLPAAVMNRTGHNAVSVATTVAELAITQRRQAVLGATLPLDDLGIGEHFDFHQVAEHALAGLLASSGHLNSAMIRVGETTEAIRTRRPATAGRYRAKLVAFDAPELGAPVVRQPPLFRAIGNLVSAGNDEDKMVDLMARAAPAAPLPGARPSRRRR